MARGALAWGIGLVAGLAGLLWLVGTGSLGRHWGPGDPVALHLPEAHLARRTQADMQGARQLGAGPERQILFGDLHVHSTFSPDAFAAALPVAGGDGARPPNDACDFARYCAELDFWALTDHAEAWTPRRWEETLESLRECDAVAKDPARPDVTVFGGWEWTQTGLTPDTHWGHHNVVLRHLDPAQIPDRPLAAQLPHGVAPDESRRRSPFVAAWRPLLHPGAGWLDLLRFRAETEAVPDCPSGPGVRELPAGCRASAATLAELFAWLDAWGSDALVIPHSTSWGLYTPAGASWDAQLAAATHDPRRQTLIELFSGHGSAESFRNWREVVFEPDGSRRCPAPTRDYEPACWRAGEIVRERCLGLEEAESECEARAEEARQIHVDAGLFGHQTVPGARAEDWLDAGQCRSCFQPAFNHRPRSSVQYIAALREFTAGAAPRRLHLGFIGSSASHSARPGTGYKEYARTEMTDARLPAAARALRPRQRRAGAPEPRARRPSSEEDAVEFGRRIEDERAASFFGTGGLVAVHADGRDRDAIWQALERREVYATSGPRIGLWFDLILPPGSGANSMPMGSETQLSEPPHFRVRALGSFEQRPGCAAHAREALGADGLERLCRGECYHPSQVRRRITRIEVVRIRPQAFAREPVDALIEDPWRIFHCDPDREGCVYSFSDPSFPGSGRDTLYYVRAIEEPGLAVNADPLRCERDARGRCTRMVPCGGVDPGSDCLARTEERAWASPIFVAHLPQPSP